MRIGILTNHSRGVHFDTAPKRIDRRLLQQNLPIATLHLEESPAAKPGFVTQDCASLVAVRAPALHRSVYGVHHWTEAVFGFGARSIAFVDAAAVSPFVHLSTIPLLTLTAYHATHMGLEQLGAYAGRILNGDKPTGSGRKKPSTCLLQHHTRQPARGKRSGVDVDSIG